MIACAYLYRCMTEPKVIKETYSESSLKWTATEECTPLRQDTDDSPRNSVETSSKSTRAGYSPKMTFQKKTGTRRNQSERPPSQAAVDTAKATLNVTASEYAQQTNANASKLGFNVLLIATPDLLNARTIKLKKEAGDLCGLTYATDNSDNPQRKKVAKDTVNDLTGLTYRQCKAVQKSWKALTANNPNQLGVQFFMRFFLNYPDYRNFYSNFRSDSDTSNKEVNRRELRVLRDTATMHDLAAAYMESLTTIFNMLDNQDEVMAILDSLTDRHLPRGVLSLHFQDMMSTLLTFMEEKVGHSNMNIVTRDAWTCALRTIITIIDQRYLELQHKKYIRKP